MPGYSARPGYCEDCGKPACGMDWEARRMHVTCPPCRRGTDKPPIPRGAAGLVAGAPWRPWYRRLIRRSAQRQREE